MNENTQKGLMTELFCQLDFTKLGIMLSAPIVADCRYDYIADINNNLIRIQCKTCSVNDEETYIKFKSRSIMSNTKENLSRKYSKDEIDYFYTCYNGQGYLINVNETSNEKILRLHACKNNQGKNINWAKDYELQKILQKDFNFKPQEHTINVITNNNTCIDCGKTITKQAIRCNSCENKSRIQEKPISREELKQLIRTQPFTQIGLQFNVSDNTIRKWCDFYNLPRKKTEINKYSDEEWRQV